MTIINLTPHEITINVEAFAGFSATVTIPASGTVARCSVESRHLGTVVIDGVAVPVTVSSYGDVTGLPPIDSTHEYIVSRIVAEACPHRGDLYIPGEAVRDAAGRVIGCRGLARLAVQS
jgi:hypothetical protein